MTECRADDVKETKLFLLGLKKLLTRFMRRGTCWNCLNDRLFACAITALQDEGWSAEKLHEELDETIALIEAAAKTTHH